jgi:hypothetical protein
MFVEILASIFVFAKIFASIFVYFLMIFSRKAKINFREICAKIRKRKFSFQPYFRSTKMMRLRNTTKKYFAFAILLRSNT